MHIKIQNGAKRRFAFTDRKVGYFQFLYGGTTQENGYHRGNKYFIKGFSCLGHVLSEAESVSVYPYGFRALFEKSKLDVSLLLDEQAFYISTDKMYNSKF